MGHTFSSGPKAEKLLSQVPSQCLLLALGQGVTGWRLRVSLPLPELSLWHDESVTASQKVTLKPAQSLRGSLPAGGHSVVVSHRPTFAAWTRTLWQPRSRPLDAVRLT